MAFQLDVPLADSNRISFEVQSGETVFVLGANGTGKSSLLHRFNRDNSQHSRRISAHRQIWFDGDMVSMSANDSRNARKNSMNYDAEPESRYRDGYHSARPNLAVYDLQDTENTRAREITAAMDKGDIAGATTLSKATAPIARLNNLFAISNLPIRLSVHEGPQLKASRNGGTPYSVARLSDGERNALIIAAEVLTVPPNTLIVIDEPERHLHRSIMSPMLTALFAERPDCAFVVSTHDVGLTLDNPKGKTLLLRDCQYERDSVKSWDADLLTDSQAIDEDLLVEIMGARRKVLFVEGEHQSLDKAIYSLIFPDVSIIPKGSCKIVEQTVSAIRAAQGLHWVAAFGLIDNDNRSDADIAALKARSVYAVSSHSVESVYYHPEFMARIAERHASVTGAEAIALLAEAGDAAIAALTPHAQRLCASVVHSAIRGQMMSSLPRKEDIALAATPVTVTVDVPSIIADEKSTFEEFIAAGDLTSLIERYPVRETGALNSIAQKLGFQGRAQYESAVRKLLVDDPNALAFARGLFDTLADDLAATETRTSEVVQAS